MAVVGLPAFAQAAPPTAPFISEIHYDNTGADLEEFVEVQLPPATTSAGLRVVFYNGSASQRNVYGEAPVPAVTADASGPAVAVVDFAGIQNGDPDAVALVDAAGMVLEFISYGGTFVAASGPAAGLTSTDIGVKETTTTPVGQSLSRTYDPTASNGEGALVWAGPAANSRGAVNPTATAEPEPEPEPEVCDVPPTHEIGAVQGSGPATTVTGQVTVRGTVVGDVPGLSGFYLQDGDGDGDAATSDGIFVYSPGTAVDLGDTVAVTGAAQEFGGQTQINSQEDVDVCADGTAADLPAPAALDLPADDAARERLEGMLVAPADTLTVSEVFDLTSFGELTLSEGGLLVQPTELARPGSDEAAAIAAGNTLRRIVLDDGVSSRVNVNTRPYLSPTTPVRVGDELTFTSPVVLGYGFSQWRLQPADGSADGTFAPQNTRPANPDEVGGDVRIGAFNVLNYFISFGPESRGAPNQAELDQQAAKIVTAINALDADVVTLMEIEDTDSTGHTLGNADAALEDLVRRLNADLGVDVWSYVPLPRELYAVDRDVIRSAIIYRNDVVQPVGDPVGLVDESVWSNAREPQAQTFVKDGDAFTVVANHFKSKRDADATGDNVDVGDGQGGYNGDRTRQAQSLIAFVEELRESTGEEDVVLMGDFNAYTQEDPMVEFYDAGYDDLGSSFDEGRYSYVFDDKSGSLDHAISTAALTEKVTGLAHWNINSVESFAYQYSGSNDLYAPNQYRSSDHDPLVLGIDLEERCQGLLPTITGTDGDDVLRGTTGVDVIMGLGGNDVITGGNADDVICGGAGDDRLTGDNGDDVLSGGFGTDTLNGANGDDTLVGGPGIDALDQGRGTGTSEQDGVES